MKVIIIGSKGFIGQNLLSYLSEKGYEVWGADVVTDYVNIEKYFLIDASNSDYKPVFQNTSYNLCINCSGAPSVQESIIDPTRDYNLNTYNIFKILEAIRIYQPSCRLINLSSAAVYGNPVTLPVKENFELSPLSPYGFHKLHAEQICKEYKILFGIQSCSLRIFSVYGPGQKKQIFWDLFRKVNAGLPFTLYGTGNESRDFIYISDLVQAIEIVALNSDFQTEVINLANGEEIYIRDAVSIFMGFFKHDISYAFSGETRKGDPLNWRADITSLESLGYRKTIDMRSGLQNLYNWITSNYVA